MVICIVERCGRKQHGRGLCHRHYEFERRSGETAYPRDDIGRFMHKVSIDPSGCWVWTGAIGKHESPSRGGDGYGRFKYKGRLLGAHRVSYELHVGPVPDGLQLDHVCHTVAVRRGRCSGGTSCLHRRCVNPDHLEPVTAVENLNRSPFTVNSVNGGKTHCIRGHEFNLENTYDSPQGKRQCKVCRLQIQHSYRQRRRAIRQAADPVATS